MNPKGMIRKATTEDLEILASIIRASFLDVAKRFSLTQDNCPEHPSNCTASWIESDLARGVQYFLLSQNGIPIGCVGLESPSIDVCYLERLSFLPGRRGNHFGIRLVQHALNHAASKGARRISIGIIAEHTALKGWYKTFGFAEVGIKRFAHLPFQVCFMELNLQKDADKKACPDGR